MSKVNRSQQAAAEATEQLPEAKLEASVQLLTFEPGLYAVELLATRMSRITGGLVVPCARLDPIDPGIASPTRVYVSALADGDFIHAGCHPAHLRVERGAASVLLTIYRLSGVAAPPELRVRRLPMPRSAVAFKATAALPSLSLALTAHLEAVGDLCVGGGDWAGEPGAGRALEGFSVSLQDELAQCNIEYQARLGVDWETPWARSGDFCGSRGMSLPLLGVRFRLAEEARKEYRCEYWGSFIGRGEVGPFEDGDLCASDGASLEALRLVVSERQQEQPGLSPDSVAVSAVEPARPESNTGRATPSPAQPKPRRGIANPRG